MGGGGVCVHQAMRRKRSAVRCGNRRNTKRRENNGGRSDDAAKMVMLAAAKRERRGGVTVGSAAEPITSSPSAAGVPDNEAASATLQNAVAVDAAVPSAATATTAATPAAKKKPSRPRIDALDSLRFFLIMYISTGHFVAFATSNAFIQAFFSQVNVVVGAFFVLSGYVAGYTSTELGKYEASPRVQPAVRYSIQRIMGFYPLYMLAQAVFLPMFAYVDNLYNGAIKTIAHLVTTTTLTQAWFPAHADIWNAPTWFLSALTFSLLALPYALPSFAAMKKKGLRKAFAVLTAVSLVAKIAYSYDLNVWTIMEGTLRKHPNLIFWNNIRFNPFYALVEVLMGVCACRFVMLDNVEGKTSSEATSAWYTKPAVLLSAMVGMLALRAANILTINDGLARGAIFIPLWSLFMMQIHRETVKGIGSDDATNTEAETETANAEPTGLTNLLRSKALVWLGSIAFPIYIFHGPIGQLFYKKAIATKVFGAVMSKKFGYSFFFVYMSVVLGVSVLVKRFFLDNKTVQGKTKEVTAKLCEMVE